MKRDACELEERAQSWQVESAQDPLNGVQHQRLHVVALGTTQGGEGVAPGGHRAWGSPWAPAGLLDMWGRGSVVSLAVLG